MRRDVRVPKWGVTIDTVTVVRWLRTVGDRVAEGEGLCEVDTDKVSAEIEAPCAGTLVELYAAVGDVLGVSDVIGVIDTEDGA